MSITEGLQQHVVAALATILHAYQSNHIIQIPDGTYMAKFPWKEDKPHLPSNIAICTRRTRSLVTKLRCHPLEMYHNIIKDRKWCRFIIKVDTASKISDIIYISHHTAKKNSQTTPIRVVYDSSCCESAQVTSLNDCLTVGQLFINNLSTTIMYNNRFVGVL